MTVTVSPTVKSDTFTPLHARLPLGEAAGLNSKGQWLQVMLPIKAILEHAYPGESYQACEGISFQGALALRRIFSLKAFPLDVQQGRSKDSNLIQRLIPGGP